MANEKPGRACSQTRFTSSRHGLVPKPVCSGKVHNAKNARGLADVTVEGHLRVGRSFKREVIIMRLFYCIEYIQIRGICSNHVAITSSKLLLLHFLFQQDTTVVDTPDLRLDGVTGWSAIVCDQTF